MEHDEPQWRELGPVVLVQVHIDRMVNGGRYEHEKIVEVDALWLGPDGLIGQRGDEQLVHAHHRLHPNKTRADNRKKFLPARLLSIGFTGHYDQMVERFGEAPIGCAAEDVVVEHAGVVSLDDLRGGVQLRRGDRVIALDGAAVAKPCVPFTKYLLQDQDAADDIVAPNRASLDDGIRGFLFGLADQSETVDVAVGDTLWVRA
ncbi:MAG: hypothetical protein AAF567_17580 [Actinomycetota bacterium]